MAFMGTFGMVSLFEAGIRASERAHPELRTMVGSRMDFMLALRKTSGIAMRTFNLKSRRAGPERYYCREARDRVGSFLELAPLSFRAPSMPMSTLVEVKDILRCPRLAQQAFGDGPRDWPVRSKEDQERACNRFPILSLLDREIFSFRGHFEGGARLEVRRAKGVHGISRFVIHVTGVPADVTEGIREMLNVLREANCLPKVMTLEEREWE